MKESKDKKLSELTPAQRASLEKKYEKYLESHKKHLQKFATSFGLTLFDLEEIVKSHLRKAKRLNKDISKEVGIEVTPEAPKKRVAKTTKVAAKGPSRVKRPYTRKTATTATPAPTTTPATPATPVTQ